MRQCIVLGGSGRIASKLVPLLLDRDWRPQLISRNIRPRQNYGNRVDWHTLDLVGFEPFPPIQATDLFYIGRIKNLVRWIDQLPVNRIVAFGTVSQSTRANGNASGIAFANELAKAEDNLVSECERRRIKWTILRAAPVYDGPDPFAANIIRTLGFFPIWRNAPGLRQPVCIDDLAQAAIQCVDAPLAYNQAFDIGGGECLSYREMVARIFTAMGKKPRLVNLPLPAFKIASKLLRLHSGYKDFATDYAERMCRDMVFDIGPARAAFGYKPRGFLTADAVSPGDPPKADAFSR